MWPRYDQGDVIICWKQTEDADAVLGREAADPHERWPPLSETRPARCRSGKF